MDEVPRDAETAVCEALSAWRTDYIARRLRLDQQILLSPGSGTTYARIGARARLFGHRVGHRCSHFTAFQVLIESGVKVGGSRIAAVFLGLATLEQGKDQQLAGVSLVREAAHGALLRMTDVEVRRYLYLVARGDFERTHGDTYLDHRVAALRVLGVQPGGGSRGAVERCIAVPEARVRLAAAEALGGIGNADSLAALTTALATERHPLVALAVLAAGQRILSRRDAKLMPADWTPFVRACFANLGRAGWRNDLAVVRLVRRLPIKSAVPTLIELMRGRKTEDPILRIVNKEASPVLAHEAWLSLRGITGALLPPDVKRWQEFWQRERDRLIVGNPKIRAAARQTRAAAAKGGFFGIPVVGRDVVFVIDTSHSMREQIERIVPSGKRPAKRGKQRWTRLDAAKQQLLIAISSMNDRSRYRIVSFSDRARSLHKKPVGARRQSSRALMKTLDGLRPAGFTNTHAALELALNAGDVRAGREPAGRVDEVFILSDGEPSEGALQDTAKILEHVEKLNRYQQIRINTVFTGTSDGADFMRRLAEQNHGVFVRYGG
ncbi:MAG: VWA domain-containing protein [Gammaproteobacteria bacterium]|nr:VWA domain-containing protein [Gammaproteobacteria bacterium]